MAISRQLTLATDDLAVEHNVPVTGTLGILVKLVRSSALTLAEANAVLSDMIRQRYRSPVDRLDEFV